MNTLKVGFRLPFSVRGVSPTPHMHIIALAVLAVRHCQVPSGILSV